MSEREGNTFVTSVSISKEFADIIKKYKLSPTEIFRAGMGLKLHELGIQGYTSILLRKRYLIAKKFMEEYHRNAKLIEISHLLEQLKNTIQGLEDEEQNTG